MVTKEPSIGIVCSLFNREITDSMLEGALARAKTRRLRVAEVVRVPGAFEIPLVVSRLLGRRDIDGVVAVGAVVQGDTRHDEAIMNAILPNLVLLGIQHGKPVGLGVSGPGMSWEQAMDRIDYGSRAVDAVSVLLGRRGVASGRHRRNGGSPRSE